MNFSSNYIPKYTPPEERDLLTYLDEDPDQSFKKKTNCKF